MDLDKVGEFLLRDLHVEKVFRVPIYRDRLSGKLVVFCVRCDEPIIESDKIPAGICNECLARGLDFPRRSAQITITPQKSTRST